MYSESAIAKASATIANILAETLRQTEERENFTGRQGTALGMFCLEAVVLRKQNVGGVEVGHLMLFIRGTYFAFSESS